MRLAGIFNKPEQEKMSSKTSKRSLYRPAKQSSVGEKKNRRRLAQGRLVSGSGQQGQPASTRQDISTSEKKNLHHDEQLSTPRKLAPKETESRSPRPRRPQDSLDLSDSEVDSLITHKKADVLVLDASRRTVSPDKAEVDVVMGYEKSPVKVICHTATGTHSLLRGEDDVTDRVKVKVDEVPHVSFVGDRSHGVISPRVVREKEIAGGPRDPKSGSRPVIVELTEGRGITPKQTSHYPQPNFDDSQELDSSSKNAASRPVADNQSVISESDACSIHELLSSSRKGPMKAKHPVKTPVKKKGKVIPSRYMQCAENRSMSSERSFAVGKKMAHKSMELPLSGKKRRPKSESRNRQPTTPLPSQHAVGQEKKTSTPTHEVSTLMQDIDASAITAETSVISLADISNIKQDKKPQKNVTKKTEEVSQDMLDTLYARYLQWVLVEAKSRQAFQSQEKQAMSQLSGLWQMNEKLAARESDLKMELARLKHQNMLDDQLCVQETGLGPVMGSLGQVQKEYNSLADSLDTTRHQIRTSGIYIPPNEDQFLDKLESALMESEQLLGELSVMTRQSTPHIKSFADALQGGKSTLQSQKLQMKGCQEMLGACQSLVIQETSLKIQDIQINASTSQLTTT